MKTKFTIIKFLIYDYLCYLGDIYKMAEETDHASRSDFQRSSLLDVIEDKNRILNKVIKF